MSRHTDKVARPVTSQHQKSVRGCGGFTFIEIIAALTLLSILAAVFGMGLVAAMESYYFSHTNVSIAQKGQAAMQRLIRELNELTDVHQAAANYIVYERVDNDPDPVARTMGIHFDPGQGVVRLFSNLPDTGPLNAGSEGGDVLCNDVEAFSLEYFKAGASWNHGQNSRLLSTIRLALSLKRPDDATHPQRFNTLVYLRNNGNNGGAAP